MGPLDPQAPVTRASVREMGTPTLLRELEVIHTICYSQPLLSRKGGVRATQPQAQPFLDMTMSYIHQSVLLKLSVLKPRDKFMSISVPQLTLKSK